MATNNVKMSILEILQSDSRTNTKTIAIMLGEQESEIVDAIKQMETDGTIVKYSTVIDTSKLDRARVEAYIELRVNPSHTQGFEGVANEIAGYDEVRSLSLMSGGYDFAVTVEGANLREVAMFVSEKLSTLDRIVTTATHFILKRYKTDGVLINNGGDADSERVSFHA